MSNGGRNILKTDCENNDTRHYDMYGHPIYYIGESGFGVSITFMGYESETPYITLFHESDNFRQCLGSIDFHGGSMEISNVFENRVLQVLKVLKCSRS